MTTELVELDLISDYPAYWAARYPEREAMVLGDIRWRYADLARKVDLYARALLANGVRHGDRVAVLATPRPESLSLFLAAARIGAMFTGLNLRFQYEELRYVVSDSRPRLLIFLPAFRERDYRDDVRRLLDEALGIEQAISFGNACPGLSHSFADFLARASEVPDAAFAAAIAAVRPRDPCLLIYTSGQPAGPRARCCPIPVSPTVRATSWTIGGWSRCGC